MTSDSAQQSRDETTAARSVDPLDPIPTMEDRHHRVAQHQIWYDRLKLILLALCVVLVAVILVITTVTLQELRGNSAENRRNTTLLVDCTTPGHQCYDESAKRTGEAVSIINRIAVYAAYCAKNLPDGVPVEQVEKCVRTELERKRP